MNMSKYSQDCFLFIMTKFSLIYWGVEEAATDLRFCRGIKFYNYCPTSCTVDRRVRW